MARFCDRCEREQKYRETEDGRDSCPIVCTTMLYSPGESRYPPEWIRDENGARCTAFEDELSAEERARRQAIADGQTDLFGGGDAMK